MVENLYKGGIGMVILILRGKVGVIDVMGHWQKNPCECVYSASSEGE